MFEKNLKPRCLIRGNISCNYVDFKGIQTEVRGGAAKFSV